jgi:hypothetical protein
MFAALAADGVEVDVGNDTVCSKEEADSGQPRDRQPGSSHATRPKQSGGPLEGANVEKFERECKKTYNKAILLSAEGNYIEAMYAWIEQSKHL